MLSPPGIVRVLSALEHVERRRILVELAKTDEPVAVPVDGEVTGNESVESEIRLDVLHYHLPRLAACGYVRFDEGEGVATRGPRFAEIQPFLGAVNGHRRSDGSTGRDA